MIVFPQKCLDRRRATIEVSLLEDPLNASASESEGGGVLRVPALGIAKCPQRTLRRSSIDGNCLMLMGFRRARKE